MRMTIPAETIVKTAILALAGALAVTLAAPAFAADYARGDIAEERLGGWYYGAPPAEERVSPFAGTIPACDAPTILSTISGEFNRREDRFWDSGLRIVEIDHVRPLAFRPWGDSFIPRRFCTATASVQHGPVVRHHRVNYLIREELGVFLQSSHDVEWCVVGVERHLHAAPNCEMLLP